MQPDDSRRRIFELQQATLRFLTDPRVINGEGTNLSTEGPLAGVDVSKLAALAHLAHSKRMIKITGLLTATCRILGSRMHALSAAFAAEHPPVNLKSYINALQFYVFLRRLWRTQEPECEYLRDLAYCEIAMSAATQSRTPRESGATLRPASEGIWIRRAPGVHLRRMNFDIHPLLKAADAPLSEVYPRHVCLIIAPDVTTGKPAVFEVHEDLFELIRTMRRWQHLSLDEMEGESSFDLISRLADLGVIEVKAGGGSRQDFV